MVLSVNQKLVVIKLIGENKRVLSGKLNEGVTSVMKDDAWKGIIDECRTEYGFDAVPVGADWKHLRDVTWYNWKKAAKEKFDKYSATGAEGGSYTQIESAVLDVLGRESASVAGLKVRDQWEDPAERSQANGVLRFDHGEHLNEYLSSAFQDRRRSWPEDGSGSCASAECSGESVGGPSKKSARVQEPSSGKSIGGSMRKGKAGQAAASTNAVPSLSKDTSSLPLDCEKTKSVKLQNELMQTQIDYLKLKMELLRIEIENAKSNQ